MARKVPVKPLSREEQPDFLYQLSKLEGVDRAEFPRLARQVTELYRDAVLAADLAALDVAEAAYGALVYVLNGGTFMGCKADADSAGYVLQRATAAAPGHVLHWGQSGEFLLEVDGMRVLVKLPSNMLGNHRMLELLAVDLDKPFLSVTGYRSAHLTVTGHLGTSVESAMRAVIQGILSSDGKPKLIDAEDRERKRSRGLPEWLSGALSGVQPDGQLAMFGDAPQKPDGKVAMSNAARQKALRMRRKEQQLKPVMLTVPERELLEKIRTMFEGAPGVGTAEALVGTLGQANGDFGMFDVGDVDLLAVWKSLRTDFSRAAVALGLLRLRNNQHAELARAVVVLQERLRAAGLSESVRDDKRPWYWNKCPPLDYRATDAPEYMERLGQTPTLADELRQTQFYLAGSEERIEQLLDDAKERSAANRVLIERLRRAGLPTDCAPLPGE